MENWGIHKVNYQLLLNPLPLRWALSYVCCFVSPSKHRYINHKSDQPNFTHHKSSIPIFVNEISVFFPFFHLLPRRHLSKTGPMAPMAWRPTASVSAVSDEDREAQLRLEELETHFLVLQLGARSATVRCLKWLVSGLSHQGIYIYMFVCIYLSTYVFSHLFMYIYIHILLYDIIYTYIYMHIWTWVISLVTTMAT